MADELSLALADHSITLADEQVEVLRRYCELLWEWNRRLNLTRHTDYEKFVTRDVVDSLQLSELLSAEQTVLDLGTGGGVPGVILAIVRADLQVSLCESVAKKARAVSEIVEALAVPAPVLHGRVEQVLPGKYFDVLVARAVGPLWKMLKWLGPHWSSVGQLLAIKGPGWVEQRREARERGLLQGLELRRAHCYQTPGTQSENVILSIRNPRARPPESSRC